VDPVVVDREELEIPLVIILVLAVHLVNLVLLVLVEEEVEGLMEEDLRLVVAVVLVLL
jgi:hypothetical protein